MKKFLSLIIFNLLLLNLGFAQWQQANGPYGGGVHVLTIDPATNYIYAGTSGGVFLSTNGGNSWTAMNNGLTNTYVQAFAISGSNFFAGTQDGLFLSTDSGNSWTSINNGLLYNGINIMTIAIGDSSIFIGTQDGGMFLSTDNGASWTAKNNGIPNEYIHVNDIAINGSNIYAATQNNGLFLSTDNGSSWTVLNNGLPETNVRTIDINGDNIFTGTDNGLFLSTDNGVNWTSINNDLPTIAIYSLAINGSNIYMGTSNGFFISENNGSSWILASNGLYNTIVESIVISGGTLIAGTWNLGVLISIDNGSNWVESNNGISSLSILSLAINGNSILAGTDNQGLFISTDNDTSWSNSSLAYGSIRSLTTDGSKIIAGTFQGVFLYNGNAWTMMNNGLTNRYVNSIALSGSNIFAGTSDGVFLSTDSCNNWIKCSTILNNKSIRSIAVLGNNIFAASYGQGIYRSTDNGSSWVVVNNGLSKKYVTSLAVSGNNLFAGTNGGVFLSTDNGNTWTIKNNGLTNKSVNSMVISGNNIFVGTFNGVFLSVNNGASWKEVSTGLTTTRVNSLAINDDDLYAGTAGGSVFKRKISNIKDLSVSTNFITGSALANQGTFNINSNTNWTVSSTESWLTANISSGSDSSAVTITTEVNPLSSPRTAKIIVNCLGANSQIITYTQFGQPTSTIPYNQDFSVWPLIDWAFTGGTINWWKYNSNSVYVDFYNLGTYKNALMTSPTFDFTGKSNLELKFNWSHLSYQGYPDELKVEISTNGSTWTTIWDKAGSDLDSQDGTDGLLPGTYVPATVSLSEYSGMPSVNIRFNGISGYGADLFLDDVSIINSNVNSDFLTVSQDTLNIGSQANSNRIFEITSNINWKVESDQSWLMVSDTIGFGNDTITITAQANPTISARIATITVSGNGVSPKTVTVTQAAAAPVLMISPNTMTISALADSTNTFDIASNISWTIESNQTWLTVGNTSGSGNATIFLVAEANPTIMERIAVITVSGMEVIPQTIIVTQEAALPSLTMTPNTLTIASPANSSATFDIKSNIGWTVVSNRNWLEVSNLFGSNDATITLTAKENHAAVNRFATVTVSGIGVPPQVVTIVQKGKKWFDKQSVSAYPNPTNGKFNLILNNYDGEVVTICVSNFMRNEITKITLNNIPDLYSQEIDLSGLSWGVYFVTVQTNNSKVVKPVILTNR